MALEQLGPSEIATFFTLARYPALLFFVGHTRAWHCRIPRAATVHISPLGRQRPSAPSTQCTAGIHLTFWFLQPSDSVVCSSRTAWGESPSRAATIPQASETWRTMRLPYHTEPRCPFCLLQSASLPSARGLSNPSGGPWPFTSFLIMVVRGRAREDVPARWWPDGG